MQESLNCSFNNFYEGIQHPNLNSFIATEAMPSESKKSHS